MILNAHECLRNAHANALQISKIEPQMSRIAYGMPTRMPLQYLARECFKNDPEFL